MTTTSPRGSPQPSASRPDIIAGWDSLAEAYQREVGWPDDVLSWGLRCPAEPEVMLVSDTIEGADTIVLGCGGGQDLLALARMGAGTLIGVDPSSEQLAHARRRLVEADVEVGLMRAMAEDLHELDDACADLVVSVQALDYVEDLATCVAEIRRILRPDGVLAFSVLHPADVSTEQQAPHGWHTSYFLEERDWVWDGLTDEEVPLRSWFRSPAGWFTALTDGGLIVERLLEPPPVRDRRWIANGWLDEDGYAKLDIVPGSILVRARRPAHRKG